MDESSPARAPNEVAVVIPAAGRGRRLGGTPKQFRTLGDHPLLVQLALLFEQHSAVGHLVVAVPEARVQAVSDRFRAEGLSKLTAVVSGGDSRQASVRHALRALADPVEFVLVHDAARPFVSAGQVQAVVETVRAEGAAALAVSVVDTLRKDSDGTFGETVPRNNLYRMQTPQGFRRDWLEEAHRAAAANDTPATDDVELVQRIGRSVTPVEGSRRNFKITTPADWRLAQTLWSSWIDDPRRTRVSSSNSA